jgi:hypothetical protein
MLRCLCWMVLTPLWHHHDREAPLEVGHVRARDGPAGGPLEVLPTISRLACGTVPAGARTSRTRVLLDLRPLRPQVPLNHYRLVQDAMVADAEERRGRSAEACFAPMLGFQRSAFALDSQIKELSEETVNNLKDTFAICLPPSPPRGPRCVTRAFSTATQGGETR